MSLKATLDKVVGSAFKAVGDLAETFTYRNLSGTTPATYDTATGTWTETPDEESVTGVFSLYRSEEVDGVATLNSDIKLLVRQSVLSATPVIDDEVVRGTDTFKVVRIREDVAQALWILQLRSTT